MTEDNVLLRALGEAQAEIPPLPMDGQNPYFHSKYTTLGKMLEIIMPIIHKHGLVLFQQAIGGRGEVGVETVLAHNESPEVIKTEIKIPLGDGNPGQEAGKVITYLRRYALGALFQLYSDEDIDGNSSKQQKKKEPTVEEIVEKYWTPLARQAEEYGVEFEPLPPNPTVAQVEKAFIALQKQVEGVE